MSFSYPYFDVPLCAMAHRGGRLSHTDRLRENTLYAFRNAYELGYRYLETDVRVTRDGHVMVFHDPDLERLTGHPGGIEELTYDEVRELRVGGIDQIVTIDELLSEFPEARFNIDLKSDDVVVPLAVALRRHGAGKRVCVASFDHDRIRRFRSLVGRNVATAASLPEVVKVAFLAPLVRLLPTPACALQIPLRYPVGGVELKIVRPALIARAHRMGVKVHVWTVNDADEMNELLDLGVDGIISDEISVLKEVLIARNAWYGA